MLKLITSSAVALTIAGSAVAASTPIYVLDFGTAGVGTNSLVGTGVEYHGVTSGVPERFFDGAGTQAPGNFVIGFKNDSSVGGGEGITDYVPNRPPAIGTALVGDRHFRPATFDGTALWLRNGTFATGTEPILPSTAGGTGSDIRPATSPTNGFLDIPVITGVTTTSVSNMQMDIYIPSHTADLTATSDDRDGMLLSPYIQRGPFGGTSPGGHGGPFTTFTNDVWHQIKIITTIITNGGVLSDASDDTFSVQYDYFKDGVFFTTDSFNTASLAIQWTTSVAGGTPIQYGPGQWIQRGWQGSAAEVYIDNITLFTPEPASMVMLIAGLAAVSTRRRRTAF